MTSNMFYEIEYDASPIPGVGKFALKPEKLRKPEKDPIRELFGQMRDIARSRRAQSDFGRYYDSKDKTLMAETFYRQAMFMKDFSDSYSGNAPFTHHYPYFQNMGYEQLRTYFTWRTNVRMGVVLETHRSYVFLYMYELLRNIGALNPQDGLEKLMFLWGEYRAFDKSIDKYVVAWLKDYFVYYDMPNTFYEFACANNLLDYYPEIEETSDEFNSFCAISKYDIRKSAFFTEELKKLIVDCFYHVLGRLRKVFLENGFCFDESTYEPARRFYEWKPFENTLFFQWLMQRDRRVVLSKKEMYVCHDNRWSFGKASITENGRQLVGYVLKQMESVLRKAAGYKHKLTANDKMLAQTAAMELQSKGISLPDIIGKATLEFYRDATKTVVNVDKNALSQIRQEALEIQEKLIIEEETELIDDIPEKDEKFNEGAKIPTNEMICHMGESLASAETRDFDAAAQASPSTTENTSANEICFTEIEKSALAAIIDGKTNIRKFAAGHGIMPEVLVGGINEKAMDIIGDCLLDDEFNLYEDYLDQAKELVK